MLILSQQKKARLTRLLRSMLRYVQRTGKGEPIEVWIRDELKYTLHENP